MKARANAKVTILRGTAPDSFGDQKDLPAEVATDVNASIIEQSKQATTPVDGSVRQVRTHVGRVPQGTDIRAGDRIRDQATSTIYIVDATKAPGNAVRGSDVILDLRRIT